jgi:hypothetical protein
MALTPEGIVKRKVKEILKRFDKTTFVNMPVPGGYGVSTLDFIGCNMGRFFAIETKAEGKKPTKLQQAMLDEIARKGGKVFVVAGAFSPVLQELEEWLG